MDTVWNWSKNFHGFIFSVLAFRKGLLMSGIVCLSGSLALILFSVSRSTLTSFLLTQVAFNSKHFFLFFGGGGFCVFWWFWYMVVVLAGLFMGCPTLLSPSICYVMLWWFMWLTTGARIVEKCAIYYENSRIFHQKPFYYKLWKFYWNFVSLYNPALTFVDYEQLNGQNSKHIFNK